MTTGCRTVLIDDVPSDIDAFSSDADEGPHHRVARAIVEMIDHETGGKVVGLEGGWGAGKSTVVNLVRINFSTHKDVIVVPFDAWAHEGDPLRRTYLERVIQQLQHEEWVNEEYWDEKIKLISQKKRDSKSTTTTKPTILGKAIALAAVAVPFGTALVGDALDNRITFDLGAPIAWQLIIGSFLSLAPLLVIALHWATAKAQGREVRWAFLDQQETESFTTTTELPNPTSIEFEDYFSELLREALAESTDRRLVLVIDNLDRVDSEDALSIWGTLQTFLQERRLRAEPWFNRVWVLVPFDPRGLRKLWDQNTGQAGTDNAISGGEGEISDSFFDKSFQIRFYIAPPVLSDWRPFLDDLLRKALPDHERHDRHLIFRVYAHCTRDRTHPPTPRELKLFVNQIGAIHRQWMDDEFPIGHVAYFVLQRQRHHQLVEKLRRGTIPTTDDARLFSKTDLIDSVAGLIFNVRPVKGRELLLHDPISNALFEDGDLLGISERHPEGFWPVFEAVVSSELAEAGAPQLARAAIRLRDSKLLTDDRYEVRTVIESLGQGVDHISDVEPWDEQMAEGIAALCDLLVDKRRSQRLFKAAGAALKTQTQPPITPDVAVLTVGMIFSVADRLGHQDMLPEIYLLLDADGWRLACAKLGQANQQEHWGRLRPTVEFPDILASLKSRAEGNQYDASDAAMVLVTSRSSLDGRWDQVALILRQRLDAGQNVPPNHAYQMLLSLWHLRSATPKAGEFLDQLVAQGHVAHHLHGMRKNVQHSALCVFASLLIMPDGSKPGAVGSSEAGYNHLLKLLGEPVKDLPMHIMNLVFRFESFDWPLRVLEARPQCDLLISECLKLASASSEKKKIFSMQELSKHWKAIAGALADGESEAVFATLIRDLDSEHELSQTLVSVGFSPNDALLYSAVLKHNDIGSPFLSWCRDGVESLSKGDWIQDFKATGSCCQLAAELRDRGTPPTLSTDLSDAVEDYARYVAQGNSVPPTIGRLFPSLLSCLREGHRKPLRARLLNIAGSRNGQFGDAFYPLFGVEIVDADNFRNPSTVSEVFVPIIRQGNVGGLTWLRDVLSHDSLLTEVARSDEDLMTRLQAHVDREVAADTEADRLTWAIATALGVASAAGTGREPDIGEHGQTKEPK